MPNNDSANLPLDLVEQYTKKYPGVWDAAQEMREMPTDAWDKQRCYLPIAVGIAVMSVLHMPHIVRGTPPKNKGERKNENST